MNKLSIIGLFCEDIREEVGEQFTLVGLMSDNISVNATAQSEDQTASENSRMLLKLCIFARANFDPKDPLKEIKLRLVLPDGQTLPVGGASPADVIKVKASAIEKGNPLAGIVMRAVLVGFKPAQSGIMRLEADIDSETRLLAGMNFEFPGATSSTEPKRPS